MNTTVSSKGQIVLPAELRQQDGIQSGQRFEIERLDCASAWAALLAILKKKGVAMSVKDSLIAATANASPSEYVAEF